MVWILAIFKPFVYIWAGLNLIDDVALVIRLARLGASIVPNPGRKDEDMCGVCDDVIGDMLAGTDGISVIPCSAACLGMKKCIAMCEKVKETSESSTEFPCVAAGFCDPEVSGYVSSSNVDCKAGRFFSCEPRQYCRRKREKFKMKCELRPGIGRWNGMKNLAASHTVALAEGLKNQRSCGEEGAGKYCIARPHGIGIIAEALGHFISLVIGGYKSVQAIETPGGNDDRQWLTFWLIFSFWIFIEKFFARIVLSTVPLYYECKLILLVWLIWRSGAEECYRRFRKNVVRIFSKCTFIISDEKAAEQTLDIMKKTGGQVVARRLKHQEQRRLSQIKAKSSWEANFEPDEYWEYDPDEMASSDVRAELFRLCKFLLSPKGAKELEDSEFISDSNVSLLIERAAQAVSFQPRYLQIKLLGSIDGPRGKMPVMDSNGEADPYVSCHLIPSNGVPYPRKGVQSKTIYCSRSPQWNQELEIPLMGGVLGEDGFFQSVSLKSAALCVRVLDADVGLWSWVFYIFRSLTLAEVILLMAAYIEGATDNATADQKQLALGITIVLLIGYAIGYYKAVLKRSDDELIGCCTVPLGMMLDQLDHTLLLTLHPEADSDKQVKSNDVGGCGVIRVKLDLTEN